MGDMMVVFGDLARQIIIGGQQAYEGADDGDVNVDCFRAAQNGGQHGNAMFGEGAGRVAFFAPT